MQYFGSELPVSTLNRSGSCSASPISARRPPSYTLLPNPHQLDFFSFAALRLRAGDRKPCPAIFGLLRATMLKFVLRLCRKPCSPRCCVVCMIYYLGPFVLALVSRVRPRARATGKVFATPCNPLKAMKLMDAASSHSAATRSPGKRWGRIFQCRSALSAMRILIVRLVVINWIFGSLWGIAARWRCSPSLQSPA